MSGRVITKFVLACDGCGTELPEAATAVEARGAAYAAGWRFPARVKANGDDSLESSDACPACLPGWTPQPCLTGGLGKNRRRTP